MKKKHIGLLICNCSVLLFSFKNVILFREWWQLAGQTDA